MKNQYKIIGYIICAFVILFSLTACEKKEKASQKQNVVSKKVVSKKISKPASKKVKKEATKTQDKEGEEKNSDAKVSASPGKAPTTSESIKKADSIEKKKISTTTLTVKKKPAFKPRSEISSENDYEEIDKPKVQIAKKIDTKTQEIPKKTLVKKDGLTVKVDEGKKPNLKKEGAKGKKLPGIDKTEKKVAETEDDKEGKTTPETGEKKEESLLGEEVANKTAEKEEKSQTTTSLKPSKSLKPVKIEPLSPDFKYKPQGKIDPFSSLFKVQEEDRKKRKRSHVMTPLEKKDISQYKLVGVILSAKGNKAIVQEDSGKGYVVTRGTYIGVNEGRVVEILKDRIVCEEEVQNLFGQIEIRSRSLILNKPPGAL